MEDTTDFDIISQFHKDNIELYNKASKMIDSINILTKMYLHQKLTSMILTINPFIYRTVKESIDRLKTMDMNGIIVNFTDLNMYAVFNYDQHRRLLNKIAESLDDEELEKSDLHLYQVVLVGQRQKLVLACTNPAYFTKLRKYIGDYFKAEVTQEGNQFTVNLYTDSEQDFETKYESFHKYINNKNDDKLYKSVKQIEVIKDGNESYRQYDMSDVPPGTAKNLQDILKIVKTISDDDFRELKLVINIGNNYNHCNVNIGNRVVNNQVATMDQRCQTARLWVSNNNPIIGELTNVYYERYKASNINPLAHCHFSPIVKEILKRDYIRGTHHRHW